MIEQAAEDWMAGNEGGYILYAYDDAVFPTRPAMPGDHIHGTLTIGAGHIGGVYIGERIDTAMARAYLASDLKASEAVVDNHVNVRLPENKRVTLVDFVLNCGAGAFINSTLLKLVNTGQLDKVPAELMKWTHTRINGKLVVSAGLIHRRAAEQAMWTGSVVMHDPANPGPYSGQIAEKRPPQINKPAAAGGALAGGAVAAAVAHGFPWVYVLAFVAVGAAIAIGVQLVKSRQ